MTPTQLSDLQLVSVWELEAEKKAAFKRIADLWADPDMSLSRDRYARHDKEIDLIRRIDVQLSELGSVDSD